MAYTAYTILCLSGAQSALKLVAPGPLDSIGGLFEHCAGDGSFTSVFVGLPRGLCSAMQRAVFARVYTNK